MTALRSGRTAATTELDALLQSEASAADLDDWATKHFEGFEAYRENDDLVLRNGAGQYLLVRRVGPRRFRVSEHVAVPSTNLLDEDGDRERDADALIDELAAFAAV
jgi:hypothetical protein